MLRISVLLVIAANLVFYLWSHGALRALGLGPQAVGEPQRLQQQVDAARLTLLPTPSASRPASAAQTAAQAQTKAAPVTAAASAASAAAAQAASAASATSATSPAGASRTPAVPTAVPSAAAAARSTPAAPAAVCLQLGPYTTSPAAVGAALRAAGLSPVARQHALPEQWMVLMGPYDGAEALHRKLAELRALKLPTGSYAPVVDRPRWEPGVSLGVFSSRAAAEQELARLRSHGIGSARVVQRNAGFEAAYWRLDGLDAAAAARLRALDADALGHRTPQPCQP
jgi:hypothetical protein